MSAGTECARSKGVTTVARNAKLLIWACVIGWAMAVSLAILVLPKVARRVFLTFPAVQRHQWDAAMATKIAELTVPWSDRRPLVVIMGDSHAALADWYQLFGGAQAVRNCGLSMAKIQDVTALVSTMSDRDPKTAVLMCGFNNLSTDLSVRECILLYNELINTTRRTLHPKRLVAVSVTPLRAGAVDKYAQNLNKKIANFNRALSELCGKSDIHFLDVAPLVSLENGNLKPSMTIDGLHLNQTGYARVATALSSALMHIDATEDPK